MSRAVGGGEGICTNCEKFPSWIVDLKEFPEKLRYPCQGCLMQAIVDGTVIVTGGKPREEDDIGNRGGYLCEQHLAPGCASPAIRIDYLTSITNSTRPMFICGPCLWYCLSGGKLDVRLAETDASTPDMPSIVATTNEDGQITLDGMEFRW